MQRLVVLSGAGISADSGVDTFRSGPNSIWAQYDPDQVCNIRTWRDNYELVHQFYSRRRCELGRVKPNAAHEMAVSWQERYGAELITQNVDDLFERAGAHDVLHVHGFITSLRCQRCGAEWDIGYTEFETTSGACANCGERHVKPNVVFFGEEAPLYGKMWSTLDALKSRDVLVIIGTSGSVMPIEQIARLSRARTILSNLESVSSLSDSAFTHVMHGRAAEIAPALDELVSGLMG